MGWGKLLPIILTLFVSFAVYTGCQKYKDPDNLGTIDLVNMEKENIFVRSSTSTEDINSIDALVNSHMPEKAA